MISDLQKIYLEPTEYIKLKFIYNIEKKKKKQN